MSDHDTTVPRRRFLKATGAAAVTGLAAGCTGNSGGGGNNGGGSTPTATATKTGTATKSATPSLADRAKQEGTVHVAQSMSGWDAFEQTFQQDTGVKVDMLRTNSSKVATRVLQEFNANKLSYDVIGFGNTVEVWAQLDKQGMFQAFVPQSVKDSGQQDARMFASNRGQELFSQEALVFLYNKDNVSNPPTTVQEWIDWDGTFALSHRDPNTLGALAMAHGMDQAKQILGELGKKTQWISSHLTMAQNIASGEIDAGVTYSKFRGYDWGGPLAKQEIDGFPDGYATASYGYSKKPHNPAASRVWMNYVQDNIVDYMNKNVYDGIFYEPEDTPKGVFVWDYQFIQGIDVDQYTKEYQDAAGYSATG